MRKRPRLVSARHSPALALPLVAALFSSALVSIGCSGARPPRAPSDEPITVASAGPAAAAPSGDAAVAGATDPLSPEGDEPTALPTLAEARAAVLPLLLATKVKATYEWDANRIAVAGRLGFDETMALRTLLTFVEQGAKDGEIFEEIDAKKRLPIGDLLFAYLGRVGSPRSLPRVAAVAARARSWQGSSAVDALLEKTAAEALAAKCAPPSAEEIQKQRVTLAGFAIVERQSGSLVAREPSSDELDDLAYFYAALAEDGGPVGHEAIVGGTPAFQKPPANVALDSAREALELAQKGGGPKAVQGAARNYLSLLGYPGAIRAEEESRMTWGGPGYANVMRELALADEVLGDVKEAAELYRRAPPGGGACGTSVPYRLETQRKGVIRSAERAGACRTVVRERLYAVQDDGFDYGPARLASAGWDVGRLYRAALLASEREAPAAELMRAFDLLSPVRRDEAVARHARLGAEAWAHDLRAARGLADAEGERALPSLISLAKKAGIAGRVEALGALAELGDLPSNDPCQPDSHLWGGFRSYGGERPRIVKQVNHVCATRLGAIAQGQIVDVFVGAAKDPNDLVREAAAGGIAAVAVPAKSEPILLVLAQDTYARPGWSHIGKNNQRTPVLPVAEAAKSALERVRDDKQRARQRTVARASTGAKLQSR